MARAVQKIRLILLLILTISWLQAETNSSLSAKRMFYLGSEEEISSGGYRFDSDGQKTGSLYFPFIYDIESESVYAPYISASIGYGATRYGSGKKWMKLYGLKLGGGIRYRPGDDWDMRIGGAYQWGISDRDTDAHIYGYDVDAIYTYHPYIGAWEPYLQGALRYKHTTHNGTDANSITARAKAGLITPVIAHPFDLPMKLEVYAEGMMLKGGIEEAFGSTYLGIAGAKAYIASPILQERVTDITFGAQYVKGEKLDGVSIGVGVKF